MRTVHPLILIRWHCREGETKIGYIFVKSLSPERRSVDAAGKKESSDNNNNNSTSGIQIHNQLSSRSFGLVMVS